MVRFRLGLLTTGFEKFEMMLGRGSGLQAAWIRRPHAQPLPLDGSQGTGLGAPGSRRFSNLNSKLAREKRDSLTVNQSCKLW